MKINLNEIDRESFYVTEHVMFGESMYLVTPKQIGCAWDTNNLIFRSSLWNSKGIPVNLSWKKFANWGEKPDIFKVPNSLNECNLIDKADGSTLIFSLWKGNIIVRTRGTVDAKTQPNGHEIDYFFMKYPQIKDILYANSAGTTSQMSLVFEWTSPLNRIVLSYGDEPDIILIGMIYHSDYSYEKQDDLDKFAEQNGFKRPVRYTFDSMKSMLEKLPTMTGIEGICVYHGRDQLISKLKTEEYLKIHRFKENATFENTVDLFFEFGMPNYQKFQEMLLQKFDHECYVLIRGFVSIICDGMKEVYKIVEEMKIRVIPLRSVSRKEAAEKIFQMWGKETNRSGFAFKLFDGKELDKNELKKLLYQTTKSN